MAGDGLLWWGSLNRIREGLWSARGERSERLSCGMAVRVCVGGMVRWLSPLVWRLVMCGCGRRVEPQQPQPQPDPQPEPEASPQ